MIGTGIAYSQCTVSGNSALVAVQGKKEEEKRDSAGQHGANRWVRVGTNTV